MALDAISGYFIEIDEIQSNVYDKIHQLEHLDTLELKYGESYEDRRATLARDGNGAIIKIPDLLLVIEIQLKQLSEKERSDALLNEKLSLYVQNWHHLKLRFKASLLEAHSIEMDLIHKQRIAEYVKTDEISGTKEDLFAGRSKKAPEDPEKKLQDQILTQNKNISSLLQLTKQLMTMSVMQTELNIESIDQQSKDLSQLNDKLMDLEGVLTRSRQIVKFIEKQDKRDKKRIYLSIGFLLCCCAWVMWRRVLKTPVRLLIWSFLQFFGVLNWATHKLKPSHADIREINVPPVSEAILFSASLATEILSQISGYETYTQEAPSKEVSAVSVASETEIASSARSEDSLDTQPELEAFVYIEEVVEDVVWVSEMLQPEETPDDINKSDTSEAEENDAIEDNANVQLGEVPAVDESLGQENTHVPNMEAEETEKENGNKTPATPEKEYVTEEIQKDQLVPALEALIQQEPVQKDEFEPVQEDETEQVKESIEELTDEVVNVSDDHAIEICGDEGKNHDAEAISSESTMEFYDPENVGTQKVGKTAQVSQNDHNKVAEESNFDVLKKSVETIIPETSEVNQDAYIATLEDRDFTPEPGVQGTDNSAEIAFSESTASLRDSTENAEGQLEPEEASEKFENVPDGESPNNVEFYSSDKTLNESPSADIISSTEEHSSSLSPSEESQPDENQSIELGNTQEEQAAFNSATHVLDEL